VEGVLRAEGEDDRQQGEEEEGCDLSDAHGRDVNAMRGKCGAIRVEGRVGSL
jgi:hypothetical protein